MNDEQERASQNEIPQKANEDEKVFLARALARFKLAAESESEFRRVAMEDIKFSIGEQWPSDIVSDRQTQGRPCLVMNRIPQNLKIVSNDYRQQRAAIQVNPVGDGADVKTAEILQGTARHIEVNSNADVAYENGFESMLRCGVGFCRGVTRYVPGLEDGQDIFILPIANPLSVYSDPSGWKLEGYDPLWAFVVEDIPLEEYKLLYPESKVATAIEYGSTGDAQSGWMGDKYVRVAEYFYIIEEAGKESGVGRQVTSRKVKWAKINAEEILDRRDMNDNMIPLFPFLGEVVEIDGVRHVAGMVRYMKDPARMYNYWVSAATEMIALAPRPPWLVVAGSTEDFQDQWQQANRRNMAVLPYKPISINGTLAPPPERIDYEPPIQAIQAMTRQADADLKYTSGINAATLGDPESERSGKAILLRQKQSSITNVNWSDNASRTIRQVGRWMIDKIQKTYDIPKIQRIINPDGTVRHVITHAGAEQEAVAKKMQTEEIKEIYNIGLGTYDVVVTTGPSYDSKRQEAVASQLALLQSFPQSAPILGDLIVRNMDWPGKDEMADRLKKALPPQFQDEGNDDPKAQLQLAQSQLQQLSQQHELLVQQLNKLTEERNSKMIENETKLKIAQIDADKDVAVAEISTKANILSERISALEELQAQFHEQAHEAAMSAQQHNQGQEVMAQQQAAQQESEQNQPQEA